MLSLFDRLVHDRKHTVELFAFDYQPEMYRPAATRRWGYFALPILHGDRLVGGLDAAADRRAGCCGCTRLTRTSRSPPTMTVAVGRKIRDLAHRLESDLTLPVERAPQWVSRWGPRRWRMSA